ncbi:hypothetical protein G1K66_12710, partial [Tenacibaculum finnmarkense]|nr:hypothetical protein [Tenacibaculum finnmarkense]
ISITFHGQTAEATEQHEEEADDEVMDQVNPLASSVGNGEEIQEKK